ncbi:hypothetical protein ACTFIV_003515 [Dictyostelium citrinum]
MDIKLNNLLFYLFFFILIIKLIKSNKCYNDDQCEPPFGYCKKDNQVLIIGGGYVNQNQNKIYFVARYTIKKIEETFLFSIPITNEYVNDGFESIKKINEELFHRRNQTKYKRVTGVQLYLENPNKDVEIITRLCNNGDINDIDKIGTEILEIPTLISKQENEGEFTQYHCLDNKLISKQYLRFNSTNYKEITSFENIIYKDLDCKSIWELESKIIFRKKYYNPPYSEFDEFGMATLHCINCSIKNYSTKLSVPKFRDSSKISFAYDFIYYVINDGIVRKPIECLKNNIDDYSLSEECRGTYILKETGLNTIQAFHNLNYLIYTTSSTIGKIININDQDLYNNSLKVILLFDHKYTIGYCHCTGNFIGEQCKTCNGTIIKNWIYATENPYCVPFDSEGYPVYCTESGSNYWESKQENSMCNYDLFGEKSRSNYYCKQRYCVNESFNQINFNPWEYYIFNWKPSDSILKIR